MRYTLKHTLMACTAALLMACSAVYAEGAKVALVIGNSAYQSKPLAGPVNDATDMERTLKELGFETLVLTDGTFLQTAEAVGKFAAMSRDADVALFFYSGHGMQDDGENFLLPIKPADPKEPHGIVSCEKILTYMEESRAKVNLIFMDACRAIPKNVVEEAAKSVPMTDKSATARSTTSAEGLAPMRAPAGALISFACAPGTKAQDSNGARNSPFTAALLKNIRTPNVPVEKLLKMVREDTIKITNGRQTPWENTSLIGEFSFNGQVQVSSTAQVGTPNEDARPYYDKLVQDLLVILPPSTEKVRFASGTIKSLVEGGEGATLMSSVIVGYIEHAMLKTGKFELIANKRLRELLDQEGIGSSDIADESTPVSHLTIKGVDAMMRGHFIYSNGRMSVNFELAFFNGGLRYPVSREVPMTSFESSLVLPRAQADAVAVQYATPVRPVENRQNRLSIERLAEALPNKEISVAVRTVDGKTVYRLGEKFSFAVSAKEDCYIAILNHQADGKTVVTYPTKDKHPNFIAAGKSMGFGPFKVTEPLGMDGVQIIACTDKKALQDYLDNLHKGVDRDAAGYGTRAIIESNARAFKFDGDDDEAPVNWGEAHFYLNTTP